MSIESVFIEKFEQSIEFAYTGGAKAAPLAGIGLALGSSLTYVAEGKHASELFRTKSLPKVKR